MITFSNNPHQMLGAVITPSTTRSTLNTIIECEESACEGRKQRRGEKEMEQGAYTKNKSLELGETNGYYWKLPRDVSYNEK